MPWTSSKRRSSTGGPERQNFAVVADEKVIGGVGLRVDSAQRRAELGYSLSREYWGRGLMPEAARAVIDWAFRQFDIAKVFALIDSRNAQSIRVMQKVGMQPEGLLRKHRHFRGEQVDEVQYSVLRADWTLVRLIRPGRAAEASLHKRCS